MKRFWEKKREKQNHDIASRGPIEAGRRRRKKRKCITCILRLIFLILFPKTLLPSDSRLSVIQTLTSA